jgi:hypothetical protein
MTTTLHWHDTNVEVHKLVVGPYDNNVFVIRCRATGDAVLIDAANEHVTMGVVRGNCPLRGLLGPFHRYSPVL